MNIEGREVDGGIGTKKVERCGKAGRWRES